MKPTDLGKVVDLLDWKDKIPLPAREEGVYRLNSSFAGARALGAPADYPVMLAPGPLLPCHG